jgi:hypothetical protein
MKTYSEKVKIEKVVNEILCNCCGAVIVDERDDYDSWSCTIKTGFVHHGSFPGQSSGSSEYDVCNKCFREKINPLLEKLPPNAKYYDCDSGITKETP